MNRLPLPDPDEAYPEQFAHAASNPAAQYYRLPPQNSSSPQLGISPTSAYHSPTGTHGNNTPFYVSQQAAPADSRGPLATSTSYHQYPYVPTHQNHQQPGIPSAYPEESHDHTQLRGGNGRTVGPTGWPPMEPLAKADDNLTPPDGYYANSRPYDYSTSAMAAGAPTSSNALPALSNFPSLPPQGQYLYANDYPQSAQLPPAPFSSSQPHLSSHLLRSQQPPEYEPGEGPSSASRSVPSYGGYYSSNPDYGPTPTTQYQMKAPSGMLLPTITPLLPPHLEDHHHQSHHHYRHDHSPSTTGLLGAQGMTRPGIKRSRSSQNTIVPETKERPRSKTSSLASASPDREETKSASDPENGSAKPRKQRARKAFEPERRLEVRRMRQTGACFRCRWLKKPCGMGTPCPQCENVRGRVWTYPCIRVNMTDLTGLSDVGLQSKHRNFLSSNIEQWTGAERSIYITHGAASASAPIQVQVEEVTTRKPEALTWKWAAGNERGNGVIWRWHDDLATPPADFRTIATPALALRKFHISESDIDGYLDHDREIKVDGIGNSVPLSLQGGSLNQTIFQAAWRYCCFSKCEMIRKAFRIKSALYFQNCLLQMLPSPPETKPLPARAHTLAPLFVKIQWDLLVDSRRAELEREVLAELQRTVFSRKRASWLSIFFTIHLILTIIEDTLWTMHAWRTKGWVLDGEGFSEQRAQEICGVLVAVFRAINQGSRPLAVESDAEDVEKVIREGWGDEGLRVFEGLRGVIRGSTPMLLAQRNAGFELTNPASLEGRFTSMLLLE